MAQLEEAETCSWLRFVYTLTPCILQL